jgi:hypothetical protein
MPSPRFITLPLPQATLDPDSSPSCKATLDPDSCPFMLARIPRQPETRARRMALCGPRGSRARRGGSGGRGRRALWQLQVFLPCALLLALRVRSNIQVSALPGLHSTVRVIRGRLPGGPLMVRFDSDFPHHLQLLLHIHLTPSIAPIVYKPLPAGAAASPMSKFHRSDMCWRERRTAVE